jgi:hypothetical protein
MEGQIRLFLCCGYSPINEEKYHNIMDKIRKAALPNGGTAFSFH